MARRRTRSERCAGFGAVDLVGGGSNMCALRADGEVLCWGTNERGELGLGHSSEVSVPTPIPAFRGARDIALGDEATCIRSEGDIRCVGNIDFVNDGEPARGDRWATLPGGPAERVIVTDRARVCVLRDGEWTCHGGYQHGNRSRGARGYHSRRRCPSR